MFKSALIKLTLWYVVLLMTFSLAFSVVMYHFSINELNEGLDKQYKALTVTEQHNDVGINIPRKESSEPAEQLLVVFIYFNLIVFICSTIISYFLAKKTLRPIEKAHQSQLRFTAHASHELRTPLAAIRADTESVLMDSNSDKDILAKTLRANLRDVQKLEKLTSHLLELAKYQSTERAVKETVDISRIIEQSLAQIRRTKTGRSRKIEYKKIKVLVNGDPIALQLLISILIDNAIKYSYKNSIIKVAIKQQAKTLEIYITNQGKGIDDETLPLVFEPFYRAHGSINNSSNGYGLGLSLAKQIVELHLGSISLYSKPKQETTVKVSLPIT